MKILYFADIRFPMERANGIQTFHTCYGLARRGHAVTLVVRPDTATPERDPFAFYGETPDDRLVVEPLAVGGQPNVRRAAWLAQALRRAIGGRGADLLMTRDLALAPHNDERVREMPVVGRLIPSRPPKPLTLPERLFYIAAYLNLGLALGIVLIVALWRWL